MLPYPSPKHGTVFCLFALLLREGLNKNINKFGGIFHGGGGGSTHSTKIINFDKNINTFQNDPNAPKHEINQ